jgi:hypothetical protein
VGKRNCTPDTWSSLDPGKAAFSGVLAWKSLEQGESVDPEAPNRSPAGSPLQENHNQVPPVSATVVDFQPVAPSVSWKRYN